MKTEESGAWHRARFVKEVVASGVVWGLKSTRGWAVIASNGNPEREVMVFWSREAEARRAAKAEWAAYQPTAIPTGAFLMNWLTGLSEAGLLVGLNWSGDLVGSEVNPDEATLEVIAEVKATNPPWLHPASVQ